MNNTVEKMVERINFKIRLAQEKYEGEWTESHALRIAEIDGMLDMLSIVTGKEYYFDENGLHER